MNSKNNELIKICSKYNYDIELLTANEWHEICKNEKLNEVFIREFANKIDWEMISAHQTMSEGFIEEFADKVHWFYISTIESLSESFINKFKHLIYWNNTPFKTRLYY